MKKTNVYIMSDRYNLLYVLSIQESHYLTSEGINFLRGVLQNLNYFQFYFLTCDLLYCEIAHKECKNIWWYLVVIENESLVKICLKKLWLISNKFKMHCCRLYCCLKVGFLQVIPIKVIIFLNFTKKNYWNN